MFGPGVSARNAALKPALVILHVKMPDGTGRPGGSRRSRSPVVMLTAFSQREDPSGMS
jgi:DNA-binding response OmpR family regulator